MYRNLNIASLGISGCQSELIELAMTYGFRGLDLDMEKLHRQVETRGLDHASRFLRSARMRVGSFAAPIRWTADEYREDLERLPKIAKTAAEVGCQACVIQTVPGREGLPYHENFEEHRRRFAEIAERLAPHNIRLGIAFSTAPPKDGEQSFINAVDAFLTLAKTVVGKNVGIVLDLWEWHFGGGTLAQLREIGVDKIVMVRVADAPAGKDALANRSRLLPGDTGIVRAMEPIAWLKEAKYPGPITPYPNPALMKGITRDQIIKRAADGLDRVCQEETRSIIPDTTAASDELVAADIDEAI